MHQTATVFDSYLYSPLFANEQMHRIFCDEALVQSWLDVEIAMSEAQAELGLIPMEAVDSIKQAAVLSNIDWPKLSQDTQYVGMAIKPVVDQIAEAGDDNVKRYLHWGGTTQDILDTAQALRLKQALELIQTQMQALMGELADMCNAHRNTTMVARTNSQDAMPTTWGLQVSSYLAEFLRHQERLHSLFPRAITGMYGGAVGNLASLEPHGIALRNLTLEKLGLTIPTGLWNASQDSIAEVIQFFALIHGSLTRIANDIELLSRAPFAELREGESGGGSSAMPHKANPRACNMIQSLSRLGWMYAAGAPNLMDQQDVRAASMRVISWAVVPQACLAVSCSLERAARLIKHLIVNDANMRKNFATSRHLIMSEAVKMKLAERIGSDEAYHLVQSVIENNLENHSMQFEDMLLADSAVTQHLNVDEINSACDPNNYLGANDALIDEVLAAFKPT